MHLFTRVPSTDQQEIPTSVSGPGGHLGADWPSRVSSVPPEQARRTGRCPRGPRKAPLVSSQPSGCGMLSSMEAPCSLFCGQAAPHRGTGSGLGSPAAVTTARRGTSAAQGGGWGGLGGARVRGGISSFGFNCRPKTCPSMACAQRLFRRASTRDDGERMEICLQSQMQAAEKGDLPLI